MAQRDKLKALQKEWYAKLKQNGFEDIEDSRGFIKKESSFFTAKHIKANYETTQAYFYKATHFLVEHDFSSLYDKIVWEYHSNGLSTRAIAKTLRAAGLKSNYDKVQKIIRRLRKIMYGQF